MDSLYQARVKKGETDLLIDQLKETLHYLTVQNKVWMLTSAGHLAIALLSCDMLRMHPLVLKNKVVKYISSV